MNNREFNLDSLLDEINEVEQAKTDIKMLLATKISLELEKRNWLKKDLKDSLGLSSQSIITKWLSGTTNFTVDTLVEIGLAIGISFFKLEVEKTETFTTTETVQVELEEGFNNIYFLNRNIDNEINVTHPSPKTLVGAIAC